jgi:hypothetical protein
MHGQQNIKTLRTMAITDTLDSELNPIFHLLALWGAHNILHVSR